LLQILKSTYQQHWWSCQEYSMHLYFNGCSITYGAGFDRQQRPGNIYPYMVSDYLGATHDNFALPGSSNYTIFMRTLQALQTNDHDLMVIQWSAVQRKWLSPGPNAYFFINGVLDKKGFDYRDISFSPKQMKTFKKTYHLLNHDYQNILDLCDYIVTLDMLAKHKAIKLIHINGILPWTKDMIEWDSNDLENSLSDYTKELLDFKDRDDWEVIQFLKKLHDYISKINPYNWVNMFNPWSSHWTDRGPQGHHPGVESHKWIAEKVIEHLK